MVIIINLVCILGVLKSQKVLNDRNLIISVDVGKDFVNFQKEEESQAINVEIDREIFKYEINSLKENCMVGLECRIFIEKNIICIKAKKIYMY